MRRTSVALFDLPGFIPAAYIHCKATRKGKLKNARAYRSLFAKIDDLELVQLFVSFLRGSLG